MKNLLVVVVLAGAGILAFALSSSASKTPKSVRAVIPDSVVWYGEAQGLEDVWSELGQTEAWTDLEHSLMVAALTKQEFVKTLLVQLEEVSLKIGYAINDENVLKFIGTEIGIGATLTEGAKAPDLILATRLNSSALRKDFLLGEGDWTALQVELERRSESADMVVARSPVEGGYTLTSLTLPDDEEASLHVVLFEDVLCLSTSKALALESIRTRVNADAKSIAELPSFRKEVKALEGEHFAFDWLNLDAARASRAVLHGMMGEEPELHGVLNGVLDSVESSPALARAWLLPESDLYQMSWEYSRSTEELFGLTETRDVESFAVDDAVVLMEASDLHTLAQQARGSAAWLQAAESEGMKTALEFLEGAWLGTILADADDSSEPQKFSSKFERTMLERVVSRQLQLWFEGDVHFSGALSETEGAELEWVSAIRLGTDGLLLMNGVMGGLAADVDYEMTEYSGSKVALLPLPGGVQSALTLCGDSLLWGSASEVETVLSRTTTPPNSQVATIREKFEPGHHAFGYLDLRRLLQRRELQANMPPEMGSIMERIIGPYYSGALYADPNFESLEIQMLAGIPEALDLTTPPSSDPFAFCKYLPEEAMVVIAGRFDAAASMGLVKELMLSVPDLVEPSDWDDAMAASSDFLGVDLEKELLPVLGPEFAYSYIFSDVAREGLGGMPMPGILFALEVRDEALVQRVLDKLFDEGNEYFEGEGAPMRLVDAGDLIVLEADEGALPIRPVMGMFEGFLIVASDESVLLSMGEVRDDQKAGIVSSPVYLRAAELSDLDGAESWMFVDFNRVLKQFGEYGELISASLPTDVPPPEYPEDGDEEEWTRRIEAWQAAQAEAVKARSVQVDEAFSSAGFMEFMSSSARREGDAMRTRMHFGLAK